MAAKAPYYDLVIGDKSLDELGIKSLITKVTFEEEFGKFDTCTIELQSGPELKEKYQLLKHGAVMQLSMGYYNQNIKPMFLGFLQGVQPNFGKRTLVLSFAQYLKAMDVGERDRVLTGKTLGDVVRTVVSDYAPLVVGRIENDDVIVSDTISQSKRSDFKLLEDIASAFASKWRLESTDTVGQWALSLERLDTEAAPVGKPMYAWPTKEAQDLTENIHLVNFTPKSNILGNVSSQVTIESNNPNQPIDVNSKKYDSDKYVSEARGSDVVYRVFGQVRRVHFYENVSDEEAAQIIADQMFQDDELTFVTAKNTPLMEGDCLVRAGQRRKVHPRGIPLFEDVFDGVYTITRTKHEISVDKGYNTWVDMGRESLTIPPPPELPPAGGGGQPVLIKWTRNGGLYGYYVSFPNGVLKLGRRITEEEIYANEYWISKIQEQLHISAAPDQQVPGPAFFISNPSAYHQATQQTLAVAYAAGQSAGGAGAYGFGTQEMTVLIDFPSEWSDGMLAENVQQANTTSPEEGVYPEGAEGEPNLVEQAIQLAQEAQEKQAQQQALEQSQTLGIGLGYGL